LGRSKSYKCKRHYQALALHKKSQVFNKFLTVETFTVGQE
jgi:hypothetical protein